MNESIVLDAGVLIAFLDDRDPHHAASVEALGSVDEGTELLTSAASFSEALVGPLRAGLEQLETALHAIRQLAGVRVVPVDEAIALDVAVVRARRPNVKTPDALILATTRIQRSQFALTTDKRLARADEALSVTEFLANS